MSDKCKFCTDEKTDKPFGDVVKIVPGIIPIQTEMNNFLRGHAINICQGHLCYVCWPYTIIQFQGEEMKIQYEPTWKSKLYSDYIYNKMKEREQIVMKILNAKKWKPENYEL